MKLLLIIMLVYINSYAIDYGKLFFDGNCVTCHFKTEKKSAPSIKEIRDNYIQAFPNKKDFIDYMSKWVLNPSVEMSIMQDAIEEFELMPELGYDEYTLRKIAEYLYNTDFSKQQK